jgi:hypothetical protein
MKITIAKFKFADQYNFQTILNLKYFFQFSVPLKFNIQTALYNPITTHTPSKLAQALKLLTCILVVPGSNLGQDTYRF